MTLHLTRRNLVASTAAMGLAAGFSGSTFAQNDTPGGIGWPREQFETKFGAGEQSGDLIVYANPYVPESQLAVEFADGVAVFIDISLPISSRDATELDQITSMFLQHDTRALSDFVVREVDGTPRWEFREFDSQSMRRLGSGADRVMTTRAYNSAGIVRLTVSLSRPEHGSGFASSANSVGVGDSMDEFESVFGEAYDGHAATGHYDSEFEVSPWDVVTVFSTRSDHMGARIDEVSAVSQAGVSEDDAVNFANTILPQTARLQAGYGAFAVPNRNQGWGISSWHLEESQSPMVLVIVGAGDGSGLVLQAATAEGIWI